MLWRGLRRKCPRCGQGKLFSRWFRMVDDCPHCHLHFEREPGYWVGAVAINTTVIGALFTILLVVFSVLTVPDIPWVTLLLLEIPIMALGPDHLLPVLEDPVGRHRSRLPLAPLTRPSDASI